MCLSQLLVKLQAASNALIYSMLEYENLNSVYCEFFPVDPPARTVCGAGLIGGHKVEIECVALA